jgi:xanthine dehydrogenase accessory factor
MQAVDKEVIGQILKWLKKGDPCWLATVVQTWGSSPRPVGSVLACDAKGHLVGSLSGGCVEDDLLEKISAGELAATRAQFFQYGITAEETEKLGLPCGGHLYIVVEPQKPEAETIQHFTELNKALEQRKCARRIVNLKSQITALEIDSGFRALQWDSDHQVLDHTFGPRHQLFIIGAGMVSQYLADMAKNLDYEITVCDPRQDLLSAFNVPGVKKINEMPDDAVREHAKDTATAIVALTHDPRIDDMGLMEALTTQAFYIGAMGSARSSASRRKRLLALDLSPTDIDKLHAPIGLPIGSKTPPEIAIAILAEITAVQKNRQNQALAAVDLLSATGS